MSGLMKKQTTENYAEISLLIPAKNKPEIEEFIRNILTFADVDYVIREDADPEKRTFSLEEIFPDLHHGSAIRGLRYREELTQEQLAKKIGVSRQHLSKMENGKCSIGKEMAKRLAKELNTVYKVFI